MLERLQQIVALVAASPYWQVAVGALAVTVVTFFANARTRAALDAALRDPQRMQPLRTFDLSHGAASRALQTKHMVIPERLWTYDEEYLERFAKAAGLAHASGYDSALHLYVKSSLRQRDIEFAVSLMIFTALVDFGVATVLSPQYPYLSRFAVLAACMGLLYGVADVAEDLKLASILKAPSRIDAGETAAANFLTRIKFVTITLSGIGIAVFLALSGLAAISIRPPTLPAPVPVTAQR
jgi:hypothetical protein